MLQGLCVLYYFFLLFASSPGAHVAVVGLGGLGHLAVQFASKMGYDVTVISTTASKQADATVSNSCRVFVLRALCV